MTFDEMHYLKQSMQKNGWKGDYYVFEKKKFYDEFYLTEKNNIPQSEENGIPFLKNAITNFIKPRSTQKIFQTKFMDYATENNIPYLLTEEESKKKLSKTTLIENKFDSFVKNREINQNPEFLKHPNFKLKEENLDDVIAYFALQSSRTPLNLFAWFNIFSNKYPYQENKQYALQFRKFYHKNYLKFFKHKYDYLLSQRNNILFVNLIIEPIDTDLKYINTVGEYNTLNLWQYKKMSPFLKSYDDEFLTDIDITINGGNSCYFLIIVPPYRTKEYYWKHLKHIMTNYRDFPFTLYENPRERAYYDKLIKEVQESWNLISLFTSYQYLICSLKEESLNFIAKQLFYFHKNNEISGQYDINEHIAKVLKLEKLLKL